MAIKQDVKQLNDYVMYYTAERPLPGIREKYQLTPESIDHLLPHYSSAYFRNRLYDSMKKADFDVPQERWFTNLAEKGNTGSASMYIMIDDLLRSGRAKEGEKVLCYIPESGRFSAAWALLTVV